MKLYKTHPGPRGPIIHVCMVASMSELYILLFELFLALFFFSFPLLFFFHIPTCSSSFSSCPGDPF